MNMKELKVEAKIINFNAPTPIEYVNIPNERLVQAEFENLKTLFAIIKNKQKR